MPPSWPKWSIKMPMITRLQKRKCSWRSRTNFKKKTNVHSSNFYLSIKDVVLERSRMEFWDLHHRRVSLIEKRTISGLFLTMESLRNLFCLSAWPQVTSMISPMHSLAATTLHKSLAVKKDSKPSKTTLEVINQI